MRFISPEIMCFEGLVDFSCTDDNAVLKVGSGVFPEASLQNSMGNSLHDCRKIVSISLNRSLQSILKSVREILNTDGVQRY